MICNIPRLCAKIAAAGIDRHVVKMLTAPLTARCPSKEFCKLTMMPFRKQLSPSCRMPGPVATKCSATAAWQSYQAIILSWCAQIH